MLGRLCRYLRAAGYDALLANGGRSDAALLRQCREEGRYFLTQDQLVQEHRAARGVALLLPQGDLDRFAAALGVHFKLDWLESPRVSWRPFGLSQATGATCSASCR